MKLFCPTCKIRFEAASINVEANIAFCQVCNEGFDVGDLVRRGYDEKVNLLDPPPGVWFEDNRDGWTLVARGVLPNWIYGVSWVVISLTVAHIVSAFATGAPTWFVVPEVAVFVTLIFAAVAGTGLYYYAGVRFISQKSSGVIRTGFTPLKWDRRFAWEDVVRIEEYGAVTPHKGNEFHTHSMAIVTRTHTYETGRSLNDHQRVYIIGALRQLLEEKQQQPSTEAKV